MSLNARVQARESAERITHLIRLIHEDTSMALAIKATGDPHSRADRMRDLALTFKAHRASLLSTVGDFLEAPTLEICGPEE